jgi:repressor LexA
MLGLSSTSSVRAALRELEKKGFVRRERGKPRAIWLSRTADRTDEGAEHSLVSVPVFEQQVAAGAPMLAGSSTAQDADYYLMFPRELVDQDQAFMVRVRGDSMRDAGILDGDLLIVHPRHMESPPPPNGTIVVASINDEITVKRLQRDDEEAYLVPANDAYRAIDGRDAVVLGTVVGVYRRL